MTGIFFGSTTGTTESVAARIAERLGVAQADVHNVAAASVEDVKKYDLLLLGSSTWGSGELQDDWPGFLDKLGKEDLSGRRVALFGCGGDRDKTKRPVMGEIGARLAAFVIVTSDNPRTEKPEAIIDDILVGLKGYDTPYTVIPDRVAAIHYAMDHAQPGDVIVLAGKGHEDYQEVCGVKHHFSDAEEVEAALQSRMAKEKEEKSE